MVKIETILKRLEKLEEITSILIERVKIYKKVIRKLGQDHIELKNTCTELEAKVIENETKTTQYLHDLLMSKPNENSMEVIKEINDIERKYIEGAEDNFDGDLEKELESVRDIISANEAWSESEQKLLEEILNE
jgi:hypothetical protein